MTWGELAARVEAATGPDRGIDALIWQLLEPERVVLYHHGSYGRLPHRPAVYGSLRDFPLAGWDDQDAIASAIGAPRITASVDAILALIAERLPDWTWRRDHDGDMWLVSPAELLNSSDEHMGLHDDPALGLCAAFCRAMATVSPEDRPNG